MKKICFLIVLFTLNLFAQSEQQSIELPDFVITGKQSIDVQTAVKPKIELVSILSKDFYTPQYSTEELPLFFQSIPSQNLPSIKFSQDYLTGKLNLMLGKYTFPFGELFLTKSIENYLFNMKIWGSNIKEYVPFAGYNNSGININNDFFISTKSDFLPGTKIKLDATYYRDSYNFYGSLFPNDKRETNNFVAKFSLINNYINYFHFGFDVAGDVFNINSNNFKEIKIDWNGFTEFTLKDFSLGGKINFIKQTLNDNVLKERAYNYFDSKAYIKIIPLNFINVESGLTFNSNSKYNFFSPFAFGELKIDKNLSLSALFNPHVEFLTNKNFITRNMFSDLTIDNSFVKYKNDLKINSTYEVKKIFTASVTLNLASIDNYVYFENNPINGKYDVLTKNDVTKFALITNFYLYNNLFGNFFGELNYQKVNDTNDKIIPFEPAWISKLNYNYNFDFGLSANFGFVYLGNYYSDLLNKNKVDNYTNLNFGLSYEILNGLKIKLDFQNILNKSNFVWQYYKEKSFDYLVGLEYQW